ncbi:hypothetical protein ACFL2A_04990 [Thermodesulfobacteriota bacterium]
MTTAIINGRKVQVPGSTSTEGIKQAGNIDKDRVLIHRKKNGNFALNHGEKVNINDGDTFVDAPKRVKGIRRHF